MIEPQFLSPLIWDVGAISLYITGSIVYLYLPLIPDLALLRDRSPRLRGLYKVLALGWTGTERQHARLEKAISMMAVAIIPIAVSVHTVVSWTLAMMLVPMWAHRDLRAVLRRRCHLQWHCCSYDRNGYPSQSLSSREIYWGPSIQQLEPPPRHDELSLGLLHACRAPHSLVWTRACRDGGLVEPPHRRVRTLFSGEW